eukprot:24334-Chlamydomonas_euryale.AAC.1
MRLDAAARLESQRKVGGGVWDGRGMETGRAVRRWQPHSQAAQPRQAGLLESRVWGPQAPTGLGLDGQGFWFGFEG